MKLDTPAGYRAIILGAIVLCIVASLSGAKAGQKGADGIKIAVFDQDKARNGYKYVETARADFNKRLQDTDLMLKTWQLNALLTDADQKKLSDLTIEESHANGNFDDAKKKEQKRLLDQSKAYTQEFNELQANRNGLNPQQKDRLNILVRAASDTDKRIEDAQNKARADLQKFDNDVTTKIMADTREVVGKVAKDKGFTVVFSSVVAWYGDTDITDAVIKALNDKK